MIKDYLIIFHTMLFILCIEIVIINLIFLSLNCRDVLFHQTFLLGMILFIWKYLMRCLNLMTFFLLLQLIMYFYMNN
jgi:hypothetical protein